MYELKGPNFFTVLNNGGDSLEIYLLNVTITDMNTSTVVNIRNASRSDLTSMANAIDVLAGFSGGDEYSILLNPARVNMAELIRRSDGTIDFRFLVDETEEDIIPDDYFVHYYAINDILEYSGCKSYNALSSMLRYICGV